MLHEQLAISQIQWKEYHISLTSSSKQYGPIETDDYLTNKCKTSHKSITWKEDHISLTSFFKKYGPTETDDYLTNKHQTLTSIRIIKLSSTTSINAKS